MLEGLKFPANAIIVNSFIIKIATFDLIDTSWLDTRFFYFPEEVPFSDNFVEFDLESRLWIKNEGFIFWAIVAHLLLFLVYLCLYKVKRVNQKLG